MKRILAAFALLMAGVLAGGWAAAQVNGSGGVYINGVLQGVGGGTGTVTSVGLTLPSFMNVSGTNPITSSGTFTLGLANVSATLAFLGPASGSPAAPTFRAIATTDLASPDAAGVLTSDGAGALSWETPAATGANTALSNLASVAINSDLIPDAPDVYTLGSIVAGWTAAYASQYSNIGGSGVSVLAANANVTADAQVGVPVSISASYAQAGDTNPGAAAGGNVIITAGNAARLTSGDANGGDIVLTPGAGIGSGKIGKVKAFADVYLTPGGIYKDAAASGGGWAIGDPSNGFGGAQMLWLAGGQEGVISNSNYTVLNWGGETYINSPSGSNMYFLVGHTTVATLSGSGLNLGTGALTLDANTRQFADTVTLTDNVKTAVVDIAIADGEFIGGTLSYTITATDATNHQALTGIVGFSGVRKAAAYSLTIAESASPVLAESSGASTLTDTWAIDAGTNVATISVTADSSLTTPTMTVRYQLMLNSANAVTKK